MSNSPFKESHLILYHFTGPISYKYLTVFVPDPRMSRARHVRVLLPVVVSGLNIPPDLHGSVVKITEVGDLLIAAVGAECLGHEPCLGVGMPISVQLSLGRVQQRINR
jgi:hypothetical protein